jgi:hypothetical protein
MKMTLVVFLIAICFGPAASAGYFVSGAGARYNIDYKTVTSLTGETSNTVGDIELIGIGGGITTLAPSNFGYSADILILGTNGQKLIPPPSWGTPWYYRVSGKGNYAFSFGLFFEVGGDLFGSFYQTAESHYFGVGVNVGIGYRFSDKFQLSIAIDNNSVLFAGDHGRVLRGQLLQLNYGF